MFDITVDRDRAILNITVRALLQEKDIERYIRRLASVMAASDFPASYATLIDVSKSPIQPRDTMDRMATKMPFLPKSRAIAVVTGAGAIKMQMRRFFPQSYARLVEARAQAIDWLINGVDPRTSSGA